MSLCPLDQSPVPYPKRKELEGSASAAAISWELSLVSRPQRTRQRFIVRFSGRSDEIVALFLNTPCLSNRNSHDVFDSTLVLRLRAVNVIRIVHRYRGDPTTISYRLFISSTVSVKAPRAVVMMANRERGCDSCIADHPVGSSAGHVRGKHP